MVPSITIVYLNGPVGSGKDTISDIFSSILKINPIFTDGSSSAEPSGHITFNVSFNEYLAQGLYSLFGHNYTKEEYEHNKNNPIADHINETRRQAAINLAEKYLKPVYGSDIFARIWLQKNLKAIKGAYNSGFNVVIKVRELGYLEELNAFLVGFSDIPNVKHFVFELNRKGISYVHNDSRYSIKKTIDNYYLYSHINDNYISDYSFSMPDLENNPNINKERLQAELVRFAGITQLKSVEKQLVSAYLGFNEQSVDCVYNSSGGAGLLAPINITSYRTEICNRDNKELHGELNFVNIDVGTPIETSQRIYSIIRLLSKR